MLRALHRAVYLSLLPHPPEHLEQNVPQLVLFLFTLPLTHNDPAILSKLKVNVLPELLVVITALPPSLLLPSTFTYWNLSFPARVSLLSEDRLTALPWHHGPHLMWLLVGWSMIFTCLSASLENTFLQSRTWLKPGAPNPWATER